LSKYQENKTEQVNTSLIHEAKLHEDHFDLSEVKTIANLSKIELTDEQCLAYAKDFDNIGKLFKELDELDISKLTRGSGNQFQNEESLREDVITDEGEGLAKFDDELLTKALPFYHKNKSVFEVPKVIEEG
jgi:aspartyl/glutamyl-tRNA(Asn/Gln) amidotransferase C subunit